MKTAARPVPAARIEKSEDVVEKYGVKCRRVGYTAFDESGAEIRFAWAEQSRFNQDEWSAYKWHDVVGRVYISSRAFPTQEEAEADALRYAKNG